MQTKTKNRIFLYSFLGVLIVGFIIGTIFDLKISHAIFIGKTNLFSMLVTSLSQLFAFTFVAFLGGAILKITLLNKDKYQGFAKFLLIFFSIGCLLCAAYFSGQEVFGYNAFNLQGIGWLIFGFLIGLAFELVAYFIGFRLANRFNSSNFLKVMIILAVNVAIVFIVLNVIKIAFRRPRFRIIIDEVEGLSYLPWYKSQTNYKDFINSVTGYQSDDFKSFPSGHVAGSLILLTGFIYLPYFVPKAKKYNVIFLISGIAFFILVSMGRMMCGGHFLSDVTMGAILMIIGVIIVNEIFIHKKLLE